MTMQLDKVAHVGAVAVGLSVGDVVVALGLGAAVHHAESGEFA